MTNHAKVGGVLSIVGGAFGILEALWVLFIIFFFQYMINITDPNAFGNPAEGQMFFNFFWLIYGGMALFFAILGILGIIGGVYALKRKAWGLTLTGAIAATMTFFPCGIVAVIFTTMRRQEFNAPVAPLPATVPPPPTPPAA